MAALRMTYVQCWAIQVVPTASRRLLLRVPQAGALGLLSAPLPLAQLGEGRPLFSKKPSQCRQL